MGVKILDQQPKKQKKQKKQKKTKKNKKKQKKTKEKKKAIGPGNVWSTKFGEKACKSTKYGYIAVESLHIYHKVETSVKKVEHE